jgi:hypothetical protein
MIAMYVAKVILGLYVQHIVLDLLKIVIIFVLKIVIMIFVDTGMNFRVPMIVTEHATVQLK